MAEFKDRRTRLTVLGILSIVSGGVCALLALLLGIVGVVSHADPGERPLDLDRRTMLVDAFLLFSLAGALVWLGLGSLKARRWVRPLMLILAWTWLLCGAVTVLYAILVLDLVIASASSEQPLPAELVFFVKFVVIALTVAAGLILPAIIIWGYQHRDVQRTCEAVNPAPSWTDRCPILVLGLSVGLAAAAFLALPGAAYAVMPLFGWLVTGWPAVLLTLVGGAACAYLAWTTFHLQPVGWIGSMVLLVAIGVSFAFTFVTVDLIDLYREFGYPERQLEIMQQYGTISASWLVGLMLLLTVACVAYMLYIRKYFSPEAKPALDPGRHD